jgi:hypothetical protein
MRRTRIMVVAAIVGSSLSSAPVLAQQPQPRPAAEAPRVIAPADEIKLDESSALRAAAIQSKMSAILANFALLQRQAQDLQTEMTRALDDRKKLLEESSKRAKVELREPTEWVYDEANKRYIRTRKNP